MKFLGGAGGLFTTTWLRSELPEQKLFNDGCVTEVHPAWVTAQESWKIRKHRVTCRQISGLESVLGRGFFFVFVFHELDTI